MNIATKPQPTANIPIDDLRLALERIERGDYVAAGDWMRAAIRRAEHDTLGPTEFCSERERCAFCRPKAAGALYGGRNEP